MIELRDFKRVHDLVLEYQTMEGRAIEFSEERTEKILFWGLLLSGVLSLLVVNTFLTASLFVLLILLCFYPNFNNKNFFKSFSFFFWKNRINKIIVKRKNEIVLELSSLRSAIKRMKYHKDWLNDSISANKIIS